MTGKKRTIISVSVVAFLAAGFLILFPVFATTSNRRDQTQIRARLGGDWQADIRTISSDKKAGRYEITFAKDGTYRDHLVLQSVPVVETKGIGTYTSTTRGVRLNGSAVDSKSGKSEPVLTTVDPGKSGWSIYYPTVNLRLNLTKL